MPLHNRFSPGQERNMASAYDAQCEGAGMAGTDEIPSVN